LQFYFVGLSLADCCKIPSQYQVILKILSGDTDAPDMVLGGHGTISICNFNKLLTCVPSPHGEEQLHDHPCCAFLCLSIYMVMTGSLLYKHCNPQQSPSMRLLAEQRWQAFTHVMMLHTRLGPGDTALGHDVITTAVTHSVKLGTAAAQLLIAGAALRPTCMCCAMAST
jgi:hypothetical protein